MKPSEYKEQLEEKSKKRYEDIVELLETGRFEQAEAELDEFLDEYPDFIPAVNKLAVIKLYNDKLKQADDLLTDILEKDTEFAPAVTNLGSIAKKNGENEKAKKYYKKAIEIDEDYGPAYNNLGVIYREEDNYAKSVKYLKKARKKGGMSYNFNTDKAFYKDPGCLFIIFLAAALIFVIYLIIT